MMTVRVAVAACLMLLSSSSKVVGNDIDGNAFGTEGTVQQQRLRRSLQWLGGLGSSSNTDIIFGNSAAAAAEQAEDEEDAPPLQQQQQQQQQNGYNGQQDQDHHDHEEHADDENQNYYPAPASSPSSSVLNDLSRYSLKFHQCRTATEPEDEGRSSVIFRLCPNTPFDDYNNGNNNNNNNNNGNYYNRGDGSCGPTCSVVYGEYKLDLEEYLAYMVQYHQSLQDLLCKTCDEICSAPPGYYDPDVVDCNTCYEECQKIENMEENGFIDAAEFLECQMIYDPEDDGLSPLFAGPVCVDEGRAIKIGVFQGDGDCLAEDYMEAIEVEDYLLDSDGYQMKLSYSLLKRAYQQQPEPEEENATDESGTTSSTSSCISCWGYNNYQDGGDWHDGDNNYNEGYFGNGYYDGHGVWHERPYDNNNNNNEGYFDEDGLWHDGPYNNNNGDSHGNNNNNNDNGDDHSGRRRRHFDNRRYLEEKRELQNYNNNNNNNYNNGFGGEYNNYQSEQAMEMCRALYESSQKCEDFMGGGRSRSSGTSGPWWQRRCVGYV